MRLRPASTDCGESSSDALSRLAAWTGPVLAVGADGGTRVQLPCPQPAQGTQALARVRLPQEVEAAAERALRCLHQLVEAEPKHAARSQRVLRLDAGLAGRHPAVDRLRLVQLRAQPGRHLGASGGAGRSQRRVDHHGHGRVDIAHQMHEPRVREQPGQPLDRERVLPRSVHPSPRAAGRQLAGGAAEAPGELLRRQRLLAEPGAIRGERRKADILDGRGQVAEPRTIGQLGDGVVLAERAGKRRDARAVGTDHEDGTARPAGDRLLDRGRGARAVKRRPREVRQPDRRRDGAGLELGLAARCDQLRVGARPLPEHLHDALSLRRLQAGLGRRGQRALPDAAVVGVVRDVHDARDEAGAAQELRVAAEPQPGCEAAQLHDQITADKAGRVKQRKRGRLLVELRVHVQRPADRRDLRLVAEHPDLLRPDQLGARLLGVPEQQLAAGSAPTSHRRPGTGRRRSGCSRSPAGRAGRARRFGRREAASPAGTAGRGSAAALRRRRRSPRSRRPAASAAPSTRGSPPATPRSGSAGSARAPTSPGRAGGGGVGGRTPVPEVVGSRWVSWWSRRTARAAPRARARRRSGHGRSLVLRGCAAGGRPRFPRRRLPPGRCRILRTGPRRSEARARSPCPG